MTAYAQHHDDPFFSGRTIALLTIVGLHVGVIYALAAGLGHKVIAVVPRSILAVVLPTPVKHVDPPPPVSDPRFVQPRIEAPPPLGSVEIPVDVDAIPADLTSGQPPPVPSTPVPEVKRVLGGPGKGFPNTEDYYPADAIRLHQQGVVAVRACVDEKGRLTAAPSIADSSGSASIDAGALRLAKAASGHYRATTEDGSPVSSCYDFRIRFQLRD